MALFKLYSYMQSIADKVIQNQLQKKDKRAFEAQQFLKVLDKIGQNIDDSSDGRHLHSIREALKLIEKLPIQNFLWGTSPFGQTLEEADYDVLLTEGEMEDDGTLPHLSNMRVDDLFIIYRTLSIYYHFLLKRKPAWGLDFDTNQNHEVMNNAIREWQEASMKLSDKPQKAYIDYKRNTSFEGMYKRMHYTDEQITQFIDNMVDKLHAPEEEKNLYKAWLKSNGGQEINYFIHLMFIHKYFTDQIMSIGNAESLEQHWFVKNNKIGYSCDMNIQTLTQATDLVIFMDPKRLHQNIDGGRLTKNYSELEEYDVKKLPPLMRVQAQIALEIEMIDGKKQVVPKISNLSVYSFTKILTVQPELEKSLKQNQQPEHRRILQH